MSQNIKKDRDSFVSHPLLLIDKDNDNQKIINIPNQQINKNQNYQTSKSWNGYSNQPRRSYNDFSPIPTNGLYLLQKNNKKYRSESVNNISDMYHDYKQYDAVNNCKSAGIIPYTIRDGITYFLFQQAANPPRKKDAGWNDFGGKKGNPSEHTAETAAREFSEETSCLFYLKEQTDNESANAYNLLKDNNELFYDADTVQLLKNILPISQKYFMEKITEFVSPIYASSKDIYISYFVKVKYIPEEEIPRAEDIHIPYETRYIRACKWISYDELMAMDEKDFHKRLQITRLQQRVHNYYEKGLFT